MSHGGKGKIVQQTFQFFFGFCQVDTMSLARQIGRTADNGLLGIDLPRVQIKHERSASLVDLPDQPARDGIRIQPKVATATGW